jgi:exosome complex exonuclease RRP6
LYIVNLFDTGQAARVLGYPSASLAHLLSRHVGFTPDKRYQMADWRMRPLSAPMRDYARCDTHYLLYCYDVLKKELLAVKGPGLSSYVVPLPEWGPQVRGYRGFGGCWQAWRGSGGFKGVEGA